MNLPRIGLRLFGRSIGYSFVPASKRSSGGQKGATRHLSHGEAGFRMTLEHKYLAIALGLLAIAVAILKWWANQ